MKPTRTYLIRNKVCAYYEEKGKTVVINCPTVDKAKEVMYYILQKKLEYNDCVRLKNEVK